ncbi:hypothetical protein [Sunxiuqinia indica]|uniref:hypothetical protein n=1 Tax=Sunxiuqinia indica TaxID=2692584 RepID=UPI00135C42E5|nr:hypothetical protein [Sunxiuqinia indica]
MKTEKIDIKNFNQSKMVARLLVLQKDFRIMDHENNEQLLNYCEGIAKENFVINAYPLKVYSNQLALFFLGSKKSAFTQFVDNL